MRELNNNQVQGIERLGLTRKEIEEVEEATRWSFLQHSGGGDVRFLVKRVRCKYELVIWLHRRTPLTIGVWVCHNKKMVQNQFQKKLGTWCPDGMRSVGYGNEGKNVQIGHVGDWQTEIEARDFIRNIESIKRIVSEIENKLEETGLTAYLENNL
jgi:hypothetical protein